MSDIKLELSYDDFNQIIPLKGEERWLEVFSAKDGLIKRVPNKPSARQFPSHADAYASTKPNGEIVITCIGERGVT